MNYLTLFILILIIPLSAQIYVSITYKKSKAIENSKKMTGYDVARKILDSNGLKDLLIVETKGNLTDHYDPSRKVIRLSTEVYNGESIAAASIAAHECGHAIQDKENYIFLKIRSFIFPLVNIATKFSYALIIIGFILEQLNLVYVGIALTVFGLIFQLITLPVEFNASSRAKDCLKNMLNKEEISEVSNMLFAAAMTYVASVLTALLQIIRLVMIFNDRD